MGSHSSTRDAEAEPLWTPVWETRVVLMCRIWPMETTERAFARTTKLGQTEDVTNCSGGMETGVNAKGNRAESSLPLEETVGAKV